MTTAEQTSGNTQTNRRNPIAVEIKSFVHSIDALQASFPTQLVLAAAMNMVCHDQLANFAKKNGEKSSDEDTYNLGPEHFLEYNRLSSRLAKAQAATAILPQAFLISLVSQYDSFLGGLLRCLYRAKPELLNASERQLTYAQLCIFGDLEKAKEHILEKEIENILRSSHADQFGAMANRFDLTLEPRLAARQRFIELTERRNLFAHCNGKVSSQYLDVCAKHDVKHEKQPATGHLLDVTPTYFAEAYACVFEIGAELAHVLWRKLLPQQQEEADDNLLMLGYDLLVAGNYDLAITLGIFATETLKKHSSDIGRRRLLVNLAQAYKWAGKADAAQKIIDAEDWSACDSLFHLAVAVLREDFKAAAGLMKVVSMSKQLKANDYRDWPIFKEFRKSQEFIETYQSIYGHGLPVLESHLADQLFGSLSGVIVRMKSELREAAKQEAPKQIEDNSAAL